jgi:hypothetical protein
MSASSFEIWSVNRGEEGVRLGFANSMEDAGDKLRKIRAEIPGRYMIRNLDTKDQIMFENDFPLP